MTIGEKIKSARINKGLTQEELGEILGIQKSAVAKYENGRIVNIKFETVKKLCACLNLNVAELLSEEPSSAELLSAYPPIRNRYDDYLYVSSPSRNSFGEDDYIIVTVTDDELCDNRILKGDAVFVARKSIVENGEIALVSIDDNNPILRNFFLYKNEDKLVLTSGNSGLEPLVFIGEEISRVKVLGKAISFQSKI